jgi:hypothetical protein
MATPPTLDASRGSPWAKAFSTLEHSGQGVPLFQPGTPALRIEENVVRVALGQALHASGAGPFAISDNHFATGGSVAVNDDVYRGRFEDTFGDAPNALTVLVVNFGFAIEALTYSFSQMTQGGLAGERGDSFLSAPSSGAVLFSNNVCQFEGRGSRARGLCSVGVLSLDHLLFTGNHLWFDSPRLSAMADAMLVAVSMNATSNRFQEASGYPVFLSAATLAALNMTTNNIATYCIVADAPLIGGVKHLHKTPNIELLCSEDLWGGASIINLRNP